MANKLWMFSYPSEGLGTSFLKKRSKRLLILRQRTAPGLGRRDGSSRELKVFWFRRAGFRLFFRKEQASF
jgi:hypothetical protein